MRKKTLALLLTILLLIPLSAFAGAAIAAAPDGAIVVSGNTFADIQAAIDAADDGDTVYIPGGVYTITSEDDTLEIINKGIKLIGAGAGETILTVTADFSDLNDKVETMIYVENSDGFEISGLTIDMKYNWVFYNGILTKKCDNIKFYNLVIQNFAYNDEEDMPEGWENPSGVFVSGGNNIEIYNSQFLNIAGYVGDPNNRDLIVGEGAGVRVYHSANNINIHDNISVNCGRGGFIVHEWCKFIEIRNNKISETKKGTYDEDGLGIEVFAGCEYVVIEDNETDVWLSLDSACYTAVRRNTIAAEDSVKYMWAAIESGGNEIEGTRNNIFTDNYAKYNQNGFSSTNLGNKEFHYIARNVFTDQTMRAVTLACDNVNSIDNYTRCYYFKDNVFTNARRDPLADQQNGGGLNLGNGSMDITIDGCVVSNNAGQGVTIGTSTNRLGRADRIYIIDSTITGNSAGRNDGAFNSNNYPNSMTTAFEVVNTEVSGNGGNNTIPRQIPFTKPVPTASFNAPMTGTVGVPVVFESTSTAAPGLGFANELWDLGAGYPRTDGDYFDSTAGDRKVTYTYDKPGNYLVSLIVWDSEGRGAVAEQWITITDGGSTATVFDWPTTAYVDNLVPAFYATYGQRLSLVELNGGSASVPGKFYWNNATDKVGDWGTNAHQVIFIPEDRGIIGARGMVNVDVGIKASPTVIWPESVMANVEDNLEDILLPSIITSTPGSFEWAEPASPATSTGVAGAFDHILKFVPDDLIHYSAIQKLIRVNVYNEKVPVVYWPEGFTVDYGTILSDIDLSALSNICPDTGAEGTVGRFAWTSPNTSTGNADAPNYFNLQFIPDATLAPGYLTLTQSTPVTVNRVKWPQQDMYDSYTFYLPANMDHNTALLGTAWTNTTRSPLRWNWASLICWELQGLPSGGWYYLDLITGKHGDHDLMFQYDMWFPNMDEINWFCGGLLPVAAETESSFDILARGMTNYLDFYATINIIAKPADFFTEEAPRFTLDMTNNRLNKPSESILSGNIYSTKYNNKVFEVLVEGSDPVTVTANNSGQITPLLEEWYGKTIQIVRPGITDLDGLKTNPGIQSLAIPPRQVTPEAVISYETERITGLVPDGQYTVNGVNNNADANGDIVIANAWFGTTVNIVHRAVTTGQNLAFASLPQSLVIPARPAAPEGVAGGNGIITGVDNTMEYRLAGTSDPWTEITASQVEVPAGIYHVRYRVTEESFRGPEVEIFVDLPFEIKPAAVVDFEFEVLTGLVANAGYTIDGAEIFADDNGKITIIGSWFGADIAIVKAGIEGASYDSEAQTLSIPLRATATSFELSSYGHIKGLEIKADLTCEYVLINDVSGVTLSLVFDDGENNPIVFEGTVVTADDLQSLPRGAYTVSLAFTKFGEAYFSIAAETAYEVTAVVTSAKPSAVVTKLTGNQNDLTITIIEVYSDNEVVEIVQKLKINNNAAGTYSVGEYKVYVDTKGNTQIRECYIVG